MVGGKHGIQALEVVVVVLILLLSFDVMGGGLVFEHLNDVHG